MPLVSVILTTHDRPQYVREALNSLELQTASENDFEILIVTDYDLGDLEFKRKEIQLKIIRVSETQLWYKHRAGIGNSSGSYISFMDDDDLFCPRKIERLVSLIGKVPETDMVVNGKLFFYDITDENISGHQCSFLDTFTFESSEFMDRKLNSFVPWYNLSSMTIRREIALQGLQLTDLLIREIDPFWYITCLDRSHKIIYDQSKLTFYRRHSGGVSRSNNRQKVCNYAKESIESYDLMLRIFNQRAALQLASMLREEWIGKSVALGCSQIEANKTDLIFDFLHYVKFLSLRYILKPIFLLFLSFLSYNYSYSLYKIFYK
jgi:glycosyltransferase involved in cell wall biosynthesis